MPGPSGVLTGIFFALAACEIALAQGEDFNSLPPSPAEKWQLFIRETFSPLTVGAGAFNGTFAQLTHSDPLYGSGWSAWSQRFGASTADIATQNFFGDFLLGAALHEDTRYRRAGPGHAFWSRVGHATRSGFLTQKDAGGMTVNWSNIAGTAISAGISNVYYPPATRNAQAAAIHFGTSVVGTGLGNLAPEFWPDFRSWVTRRLHGFR